MFKKRMWAACLLAIVTLSSEVSDARMPKGAIPVSEDDVLFHIRHVLAKMKKDERWERAPQLAQIIHDEAKRYRIDPLVLAVIVQAESTFREGDVRGKLGELGLTQIWGAARNCDKTANLKTSRGQIRAGACWYAFALDKCRTEVAALHAYQSGSCKSSAYGPIHRSRILKRARARIWQRQRDTDYILSPTKPPTPTGKSQYADRHMSPALSVKEQLTL